MWYVRQIESFAGQNWFLSFSAGQMSDVRRYFKACFLAGWTQASQYITIRDYLTISRRSRGDYKLI